MRTSHVKPDKQEEDKETKSSGGQSLSQSSHNTAVILQSLKEEETTNSDQEIKNQPNKIFSSPEKSKSLQSDFLELRRRLLELTTADSIAWVEAIESLYDAIKHYPEDEILPSVKNLLKLAQMPEVLLARPEKLASSHVPFAKSVKHRFLALTKANKPKAQKKQRLDSKDAIFTHYNSFLEQLTHLIAELEQKKPIEKYQQLLIPLKKLFNFYSEYKRNFRELPLEERNALQRRVRITGARIGTCYLTPEAAQKILGEPVNESGHSEVTAVGGIHFKREPYAPGIEFAVNKFCEIVCGYGVNATELLKIESSEGSFAVLAAKTIEGPNLKQFITRNWQYPSFERSNFSAMAILSILVNPYDAKLDNHIIETVQADNDNAEKLYRLIGIDNDMAFADAVIKRADDKHITNVRSIVYCLPQMQEPIDAKFREKFLQLIPEIVILEWLQALLIQNRYYNELAEKGVFTPEELAELKLPIHFVPTMDDKLGTVARVYQKLRQLQKILREHDKVTHNDLLKKAEPLVYQFYQELIKLNCGPELTLNFLYRNINPQVRWTMEQMLSKSEDTEGNADLLSTIVHQEANWWDFVEKRTQTIEGAIEEFISSLDFVKLGDAQLQKKVLKKIIEMSMFSNLRLHNCLVLTDKDLTKLINSNIQNGQKLHRLHLIGCPEITEQGLKTVAQYSPRVEIQVSQSAQIGAKTWPEVANDFQDFALVLADGFPLKLKVNSETIRHPLHEAAKSGSIAALQFLFKLNSTLSLSDKDNNQCTLLHYASQKGHIKLVHFLLKNGVDANTIDIDGKSALHRAAINGNAAIVGLLLRAGAKLGQQTHSGETALHYAAQYGNLNVIKRLLRGKDKNERDKLLQIGDLYSKTPIHQAAFNADPAVLQYFLTLGVDVNIANTHGYTPLHFAVREGHLEAIRTLLECGADPMLKNVDGKTAAAIAENSNLANREAIVQYIKFHLLNSNNSKRESSAKFYNNVVKSNSLLTAKINWELIDDLTIAIKQLQETCQLHQTIYGEMHPQIAYDLVYLGDAYQAVKNYAAALNSYQQAQERLKCCFDQGHFDYKQLQERIDTCQEQLFVVEDSQLEKNNKLDAQSLEPSLKPYSKF